MRKPPLRLGKPRAPTWVTPFRDDVEGDGLNP